MTTFLNLFYRKLNTQFKIHLKTKILRQISVLQIMNITITFAPIGFPKKKHCTHIINNHA
jgi:hypothetical protein